MTPEQLQLALELFEEACDLSPHERVALLDSRCNGDAAVRARVEAMLRDDEAPSGVLSSDARGVGAEFLAAEIASEHSHPEQIGRYRVVREVGRGGMGVVYEAEQDNPRRRVALKVIRDGFTSRQLVRRFEQEAHILGQLEHPGIARVYDAGSAHIGNSEWPYYAMEYIDGPPVHMFVHEQRLSTREILELVARICDAVQHAHQRAIIHRDLKPANVLVIEHGTTVATGSSIVSDGIGQPKVVDFGIARATDTEQFESIQTQTGRSLARSPT